MGVTLRGVSLALAERAGCPAASQTVVAAAVTASSTFEGSSARMRGAYRNLGFSDMGRAHNRSPPAGYPLSVIASAGSGPQIGGDIKTRRAFRCDAA